MLTILAVVVLALGAPLLLILAAAWWSHWRIRALLAGLVPKLTRLAIAYVLDLAVDLTTGAGWPFVGATLQARHSGDAESQDGCDDDVGELHVESVG